jgi:hypothetical protein
LCARPEFATLPRRRSWAVPLIKDVFVNTPAKHVCIVWVTTVVIELALRGLIVFQYDHIHMEELEHNIWLFLLLLGAMAIGWIEALWALSVRVVKRKDETLRWGWFYVGWAAIVIQLAFLTTVFLTL